MGVFGVTDLCSTQSQKLSSHSITPAGRGISKVEDREPGNDDAVWVAMLRSQHHSEKLHGVIWRLFHQVEKIDQRRREVGDADRKAFLQVLRRSFRDRSHTPVWTSIVFTLAASVLTPLLGLLAGPLTASLVCISWAAIHRQRTV